MTRSVHTFLQTLASVFDSHRDPLIIAFTSSFSAHPDDTYLIEVDPWYYGLHCISADLPLVTEFAPPDSDAEAYELSGIDVHALTMDVIWGWIADCWAAAEGPTAFPVAYANLHGYYDHYFDLSSREWMPATAAFPSSKL